MQIRLVSSLTPDDEERLAPELLAALRAVLDSLPVSYTIRIEGVDKEFVRHTQMPAAVPRPQRTRPRWVSRPSGSL